MGRQSRHKQHVRRTRAAAFTILSPGILEVLSIGKGDLKIEIGDTNHDRAKAQQVIEEMLRKGYTLFVETADGPLKVTKFLPDKMAYLVADTPDVAPDSDELEDDKPAEPEDAEPSPARPAAGIKTAGGKRGRPPRTVPVPGSKTTAIGRTAGG